MSGLTPSEVERIALAVAAAMGGGTAPATVAPVKPARPASATPPPGPAAAPAPATSTDDGIYPDVNAAVAAAKAAAVAVSGLPLSRRKALIANLRNRLMPAAEDLAKRAHAETGLGRVEHKVLKNRLVTEKTPGPEALDPTAWTGDRGLTLVEPAPYGVLGAITPVTNPTSTIICNAIGMISAGNAVVFNVHPSAVDCSMRTVRIINRAIVEAGGPPDLATAASRPTVASAQELMKHPDVRLLVVTGGAGVVDAAMQSGKRAICAGPGNPPVVVDATADLAAAARDLVYGASFDNNIICVDEKVLIVVDGVADALIAEMRGQRARIVDAGELPALEGAIFSETRGPGRPGVVTKDLIGQDAEVILERAGLPADAETRLVVAEVPADHPLVWTEQMMPVLPLVRVPDVGRAIALAREAERGNGHSAGMHSHDIDALSRMAREMNTSIFVKNGPLISGLGAGGEGFTSFTAATPTGEGLTGPRSFSRSRRCVMVDHFRIT